MRATWLEFAENSFFSLSFKKVMSLQLFQSENRSSAEGSKILQFEVIAATLQGLVFVMDVCQFSVLHTFRCTQAKGVAGLHSCQSHGSVEADGFAF